MLLCHVRLLSSTWHKMLSARMNLWTKTRRLHKEVLLIIVSGDEVERDANKQGILNPGGHFSHMSTSWFKQLNEEAVVWMQDHSVDHSCYNTHTWTNRDCLATTTMFFFFKRASCVTTCIEQIECFIVIKLLLYFTLHAPLNIHMCRCRKKV